MFDLVASLSKGGVDALFPVQDAGLVERPPRWGISVGRRHSHATHSWVVHGVCML